MTQTDETQTLRTANPLPPIKHQYREYQTPARAQFIQLKAILLATAMYLVSVHELIISHRVPVLHAALG